VRIKTDENLPAEAAATLRECGLDTETVWDESLVGSDDEGIAARVRSEGRVLLTLDLDFANIRAYPPDQYPGIIVLRLKRQDKASVVAYVRRIAAALEERSPDGELWIVEGDRYASGVRSRNARRLPVPNPNVPSRLPATRPSGRTCHERSLRRL
jgi:predicted nuclease of predicted toxin-antitoxin system